MPEIILIVVFVIAVFILKIKHKEFKYALAARIAMAAMMLTTAIAHFVFTKGMTMMLPGIIPYKAAIIYFTGFLEAMAAIGLLIPRYKRITGWLLILFFILIVPTNVYAAIHHVNLEAATYDGPGQLYLLYRIPLQLFYIVWVYYSSLRITVSG